MKIIDKVLFNRPSFKDMGIENKITKIAASESVINKVKEQLPVLENSEEIIRVLTTHETTFVNYDKAPQEVKGLVVHEEGSSEKIVVGVNYFKGEHGNEAIMSEDGEHIATASATGISVTSLPTLLKNKTLVDYIHDFDTTTIKEIIAPVNPPIKMPKGTMYLRGRAIAPTLILKERYKNILVKDYYPLVGELESEVSIKSVSERTQPQIHMAPPFKSEKAIDAHPIILHSMEVTKYLAEHGDVLESEMGKVTDADKKRFETDNEMRVVACKAILGEIRIGL